MGQCFESQVSFFSFNWLIRGLFHELHADIRPMEGNGVALKHYQISVFYIELDGSDVLDADDSF
jgi:hypothetical protein